MQQALLERLQRRQTADQRLVRRAAILLALAADPCVQAVARRLGLTRLTVRLWRDRWREATPALQQAEQGQASPQQLLALIHDLLSDDDRPGAPATFTPEQIVQVVAVACEPPEKSGRPLDHWTARELADEVNAPLGQSPGLLIGRTDRGHLLGERLRVFGVGVQPVAAAMRLQFGPHLKSYAGKLRLRQG